LLLFWLAEPLGWIGLVATLWCAYFFRDPWRVTPRRSGLMVSPADGRVLSVAPAMPPAGLGFRASPMSRIGIFLHGFRVHVNPGADGRRRGEARFRRRQVRKCRPRQGERG